ncbi:glycosyltransferase family 2 protein [Microbacterium sp. HD4P20]|uniref:glycosyltransferase n=1 Tax=Microbacterium sp. HD4P20 TaxID=2864874 RepID=UPI001C6414CA|nr:glycosyltransferase family 2 protein [Microbacterium sp. HD4P20]MCP2636239.1 glycosyltransferase family 2 protein [Microbacterium sp. HD4P20]
MPERLAVEYVLPLRWSDDAGLDELSRYLRELADWLDVTVVDGSDAPHFSVQGRTWSFARHIRPDGEGINGKARGAVTGIRESRHERIVIADDDVRYDRPALERLISLLDVVDFVRPQNVFDPTPWHARWDTGRTLLNRALGGDFSGTVALRRSAMQGRGYDTNVLFENLELERTVQARGGSVLVARDLYVMRRPPDVRRFLEQRVRQAYDDFAQPMRLMRELLILPIVVFAARHGGYRALLAGMLAVIALAELGRRRDGGARVFPASAALWAPAWVAERGITVWIALVHRLRGGVIYRDGRLRRAATPMRRLREENR